MAATVLCARLDDGALVEVEATVDGDPESLLLLRNGSVVRAFRNVCPHAGRRLDWAPGQFLRTGDGQLVCAAHGATFELDTGLCTAGPCRGQSLLPVPVRLDGDAVLLDGPPG